MIERLPGIYPGNTRRNLLIGILYLIALPVLLILSPLILGIAVSRNSYGLASRFAAIPGIDSNGGLRSGVIAGSAVFILLAMISAAGSTDTSLDNSDPIGPPTQGSTTVMDGTTDHASTETDGTTLDEKDTLRSTIEISTPSQTTTSTQSPTITTATPSTSTTVPTQTTRVVTSSDTTTTTRLTTVLPTETLERDGILSIARIQADAPGNDHENLNEEYIVFENTGDHSLDIGGWTVLDAADHDYHFPTGFTLDPGAQVTLYTGSGTNTATELYWNSKRAVWNNDGDTIYVYNTDGEKVLERSY